MKRELVESYSDWNEIRLEVYLRIASELIELEGECEKKMDELKSYIEKYGHEFWTIIDRIVSYRKDTQQKPISAGKCIFVGSWIMNVWCVMWKGMCDVEK